MGKRRRGKGIICNIHENIKLKLKFASSECNNPVYASLAYNLPQVFALYFCSWTTKSWRLKLTEKQCTPRISTDTNFKVKLNQSESELYDSPVILSSGNMAASFALDFDRKGWLYILLPALLILNFIKFSVYSR